MLDQRTSTLLEIINKKCAYGSYEIISVDELILEFPTFLGADEDLVKEMIKYLSTSGYLAVRYDKDGEFCLSPTDKGRLYFETNKPLLKKEKRALIGLSTGFYNFLALFFGIVLSVLTLKLLGAI